MDGALFIDKPEGITSTRVVEKVRKKLRVRVGHTGTLDPMATGLLILLVGRATRFAWLFQELPKTYIAEGKLGEITDTYDSEGEVLERREVSVGCGELGTLVNGFEGKLLQTPPPFSAKKVRGRRAYRLARKGKSLQLNPVEVEVYSLELLECRIPYFRLSATVSSGTYVRSLIHDIGLKAGCGAVLIDLRRTGVGIYSVESAVSLEEFLASQDPERYMLDISEALRFLGRVDLDALQRSRLEKGSPVYVGSAGTEGNVRIFSDQRFMGVGELRDGILKPVRLLPDIGS